MSRKLWYLEKNEHFVKIIKSVFNLEISPTITIIMCRSQFNNYGLQLYIVQKCIFTVILNKKNISLSQKDLFNP